MRRQKAVLISDRHLAAVVGRDGPQVSDALTERRPSGHGRPVKGQDDDRAGLGGQDVDADVPATRDVDARPRRHAPPPAYSEVHLLCLERPRWDLPRVRPPTRRPHRDDLPGHLIEQRLFAGVGPVRPVGGEQPGGHVPWVPVVSRRAAAVCCASLASCSTNASTWASRSDVLSMRSGASRPRSFARRSRSRTHDVTAAST